MHAGNETYTDRTWIHEGINPETGKPAREEMLDDSDCFLPGIQENLLINYMLGNTCANPCGDPENDGYRKFDFETHCTAFRVIAKPIENWEIDPVSLKLKYHVKAVYTISI